MSHQSAWTDFPSAVATLASQMLAVSQEAWGPGALERQSGVNEGGGTTVMVHKERLQVYTKKKINCSE